MRSSLFIALALSFFASPSMACDANLDCPADSICVEGVCRYTGNEEVNPETDCNLLSCSDCIDGYGCLDEYGCLVNPPDNEHFCYNRDTDSWEAAKMCAVAGSCSPDGIYEPCNGHPVVCENGCDVNGCLPKPFSFSCEDASVIPVCVGNTLLSCVDGVKVETECEAGICVNYQMSGGVCLTAAQDCDPASFGHYCNGSILVTCVDGHVNQEDCGAYPYGVCVDDFRECVFTGAEPPIETPCDEASFVNYCDDDGVLVACVDSVIVKDDCGTSGVCVPSLDTGAMCIYTNCKGAKCAQEECDSATFTPRCDGDVLETCENGLVWREDCSAIEFGVCVDGSSRCHATGALVEGTPCDDSFSTFCDNEFIWSCEDGAVKRIDCSVHGANFFCGEEEGMFACLDAVTDCKGAKCLELECDEVTYAPQCQENLLTKCVNGHIVGKDCTEQDLVCGEGANGGPSCVSDELGSSEPGNELDAGTSGGNESGAVIERAGDAAVGSDNAASQDGSKSSDNGGCSSVPGQSSGFLGLLPLFGLLALRRRK